jgi:hypothetical protein
LIAQFYQIRIDAAVHFVAWILIGAPFRMQIFRCFRAPIWPGLDQVAPWGLIILALFFLSVTSPRRIKLTPDLSEGDIPAPEPHFTIY